MTADDRSKRSKFAVSKWGGLLGINPQLAAACAEGTLQIRSVLEQDIRANSARFRPIFTILDSTDRITVFVSIF